MKLQLVQHQRDQLESSRSQLQAKVPLGVIDARELIICLKVDEQDTLLSRMDALQARLQKVMSALLVSPSSDEKEPNSDLALAIPAPLPPAPVPTIETQASTFDSPLHAPLQLASPRTPDTKLPNFQSIFQALLAPPAPHDLAPPYSGQLRNGTKPSFNTCTYNKQTNCLRSYSFYLLHHVRADAPRMPTAAPCAVKSADASASRTPPKPRAPPSESLLTPVADDTYDHGPIMPFEARTARSRSKFLGATADTTYRSSPTARPRANTMPRPVHKPVVMK